MTGSNIPPPPKRQNNTEHCRPDQTPWWKTAIELAAVLTAIWYAIVATRQLGIMSDQLTEMQRQTTLNRQQLVGTTGAKMVFQEPQLAPDPHTGRPQILINIVNQGHIISPEVHGTLEIDVVSFPDMKRVIIHTVKSIKDWQIKEGSSTVQKYSLDDFGTPEPQ
jgi:hypothetical protein